MLFRLVIYDTEEENKYAALDSYEYLGNREAVWFLWYTFARVLGKRHVEIYNLIGQKQRPEDGIVTLTDYSI